MARSSRKKRLPWIWTLFLVLFTGCATTPHPGPAIPVPGKQVKVSQSMLNLPAPAEGSLWTPSAPVLFLDQRARHVGDTVTVDIVENNSSSATADTTANRTSTLEAGIPNLLGKNLNQGSNNDLLSANLSKKYQAQGSTDRSGTVTASIGARVTQVLPNGDLVIYGERETKVNNEVQYIRVSGIIRPDDIGQDNRIQSTYIADAHIEYYGKGSLGDQLQPGFLMRVLDKIWPF